MTKLIWIPTVFLTSVLLGLMLWCAYYARLDASLIGCMLAFAGFAAGLNVMALGFK